MQMNLPHVLASLALNLAERLSKNVSDAEGNSSTLRRNAAKINPFNYYDANNLNMNHMNMTHKLSSN